MSSVLEFTCSICGATHGGPPLAYAAEAPAHWRPEMEADPDSELASDACVIRGKAFFLRGVIEIPVIGVDDVFAWGVWVSLSPENFARIGELWEVLGRESEPPYFGWLSTELPIYSRSTINLKTNLHTRPLGQRPFIELEPTDHPLAMEQRAGISLARVRQIAEVLLHSDGSAG